MSTFKGLVAEFPEIRIDYFRTITGVTPPLVCFLSHVHSDHLLGLESLKAPFIYCSAATRELLLRLEKYPHRMNFAKGILECRKQHYKNLKNLLKSIPLETPTCLELSPGREIRVTLFDMHVDSYKMRLYKSLTASGEGAPIPEAFALAGFKCGNRHHPGCLTSDPTVRLHGCERGMACSTVMSSDVVHIIPIISRLGNGLELPEVGAGGGQGDLLQVHELELSDTTAVGSLMNLCKTQVHDVEAFARVCSLISKAMLSTRQVLSLEAGLLNKENTIPLTELIELLVKEAEEEETNNKSAENRTSDVTPKHDVKILPRRITFPYSRHSSYEELCHLVEAFHPKDIYPCTVVEEEQWNSSLSMQSLFGHLCSGNEFSHDQEMLAAQESRGVGRVKKRQRLEESSQDVAISPHSQRTQTTEASPAASQEHEQNATSLLPHNVDLLTPTQINLNDPAILPEAAQHGNATSNEPTLSETQAVRERNQRLHAIQKALKSRMGRKRAETPAGESASDVSSSIEPSVTRRASPPHLRRQKSTHVRQDFVPSSSTSLPNIQRATPAPESRPENQVQTRSAETSNINFTIEETLNPDLSSAQSPSLQHPEITTSTSQNQASPLYQPFPGSSSAPPNLIDDSQSSISHLDDDADDSEGPISPSRLEDRRDAYRAALATLYTGDKSVISWTDFSLLSAGNSHSREEEEL
ncbi:hypothetical protein L228DRAFT_283232 [Xylona heveae TC161]|uniref:Protein artemis n=1 Tax=Xylona heveae (strain CBS 132557 / TC161) TaxID=1328760 RepID=A0A165GCV8_XYLHT|nr:hypothetical protein L228DRAFT_283232 [Xylona heveae TC161]KZF22039.1 hypothetical protein L228DRAFT_283232 [Xylona heveae TC161]